MKFPDIRWLALGWALAAPVWAGSYPQRVISMSPHFTEILYDIGAQDQLVGVTDFCKYPPAARQKEKVGGFYNPSFEKIVALKPDLVLMVPFDPRSISGLKKLGLRVLVKDDSSVQDVLETYTLLGKVLGHPAQAARARRRLEARLEAVQKGRVGREPVSVLFVVGHNVGAIEGIYAAGGKSFVGQILRDSGGRNVLEDAAEAFPLVSKEALIREDPEVIVDAMPGDEASEDTLKKARAAWARLPFLRAVRHHRVYFIRNDEMTIPGPTMVDLAEYLSGIFGEAQRDLR